LHGRIIGRKNAGFTGLNSRKDTYTVETAKVENLYIGIDPGANGGLAILHSRAVVCCPIAEEYQQVWQVLNHWIEGERPNFGGKVYILMEKVTGFMGKASRINQDGQESNRQPGSRMFNFGRSYGVLEGFLIGFSQQYKRYVEWDTVTPQKWQRGLNIPKKRKGETDARWKGRLKYHAQYLFPRNFVTLSVSDALLIASYARQTYSTTQEK
jgi:hypothetical protein